MSTCPAGLQYSRGVVHDVLAGSDAAARAMRAYLAELADRGIDPPIWQSANSPGGDEANAAHIAAFRGRVKRL